MPAQRWVRLQKPFQPVPGCGAQGERSACTWDMGEAPSCEREMTRKVFQSQLPFQVVLGLPSLSTPIPVTVRVSSEKAMERCFISQVVTPLVLMAWNWILFASVLGQEIRAGVVVGSSWSAACRMQAKKRLINYYHRRGKCNQTPRWMGEKKHEGQS